MLMDDGLILFSLQMKNLHVSYLMQQEFVLKRPKKFFILKIILYAFTVQLLYDYKILLILKYLLQKSGI